MDNLIKYLNINPGTGIIIAAVVGLVSVAGLIFQKEKKDMSNNSPHISAGGNITSGGNIVVGNSNTIGQIETPEIVLALGGSGATKQFEGHIEKHSSFSLVAESIEINGLVTKLDQTFTRLFFLKNLNFSPDLLTIKQDHITAKVIYRTLDGTRFEYSQNMGQENRADGLFNVALIGSPTLRKI